MLLSIRSRDPLKPRRMRGARLRFDLIACGLAAVAVPLLASSGTASAGPYTDFGHGPSGMVAWVSAVDAIVRGPMDIALPALGEASLGTPANVLGAATGDSGDVVSLGDGGSALLYFASGIGNGPADDFAVFENGFMDLFEGLFAELAFVEVSSDGLVFARFETETLNGTSIGSFGYLDPSDYFGFAGRHEAGIGTGFDLADLADHPLVQTGAIDLYDVRYVRIIDVVGDGSTSDSGGNPVFDPYPTPFAAGGFDLEAVGVVHVPEPMLTAGLGVGVLVLMIGLGRARRPSVRSGGTLPALLLVGLLSTTAVASAVGARTATWEDLGLGVEDFENGSDLAGGYTTGGIFFENSYTTAEFGGQIFEIFSGFAVSTLTDNTTPGFGNQFSAFPGSGAGGSNAYGVGFETARIILPESSLVLGADFTNTTYAALSMQNGDAFAKRFGGASGDDPDFFRLLIEGIDDSGASTGTIEFMLADYRFADNTLDFIVDQWVSLDLQGLGEVRELLFRFESSDVGSFGINTPQYFAIDNLVTIPEPGTAILVGLGLLGCARLRPGHGSPPATRR